MLMQRVQVGESYAVSLSYAWCQADKTDMPGTYGNVRAIRAISLYGYFPATVTMLCDSGDLLACVDLTTGPEGTPDSFMPGIDPATVTLALRPPQLAGTWTGFWADRLLDDLEEMLREQDTGSEA